jgi:hypothetical protein
MASPREADSATDVPLASTRSPTMAASCLSSEGHDLRSGGVLWRLKHQQGVLDEVNFRVGKERTYDNQQA